MSGTTKNIFNEVITLLPSTPNIKLQHKCFNHFASGSENALNLAAFTSLCNSLFCNSNESYHVEAKHISEMFYIFDRNKDGKIDSEEFSFCWHEWMTNILWPVSCLLAVDIQNDFISGTLALKSCPAGEDGVDVVPVINNLTSSIPFHSVIYSLDWHPEGHISFYDSRHLRPVHPSSKVGHEEAKMFDEITFEGPQKVPQRLWPTHCVQNTWGAKLHDDLKVDKNAVLIYKGTHPDIDSYSAFWDNSRLSQTQLTAELKKQNITDVFVCGLAYDVCVGSTANDSLEMGFRTILIEDAAKGVESCNICKTREHLCSRDAVIVTSDQVEAMVKGLDRKPQLAYRAALLLADK